MATAGMLFSEAVRQHNSLELIYRTQHLLLSDRTRLLVQGVLKDESAEQFLWALAAVKRLCQDRMPESIFTDADPAAELALNTLFPSCGKYR